MHTQIAMPKTMSLDSGYIGLLADALSPLLQPFNVLRGVQKLTLEPVMLVPGDLTKLVSVFFFLLGRSGQAGERGFGTFQGVDVGLWVCGCARI